MQITNIKIELLRNKRRLRAVASITLDDALILNDIKILQMPEGLCVEFPRNECARGRNAVEYIVTPRSAEVRTKMEHQIINAYERAVLSFVREVS